ncbi:MAG: NAD-dependent protein deacylase, partial [Butyrivibrio sp.]|nr:NAD-dependent protein deacylase [Butyrivibrio sp.]
MSDVERLKELIDASDNVVFFGGAGVSTESGIPDFRSKDGLYNQHDVRFDMYQPEYLLSHSCLVYEPKVYYEFHRQKMDTRNIEPNNAHKYLARLEEMGKLKAIVTQNIDGLHQKAGSKVVYEIHGSALRNYCMSCGKEFPSDYIFESKEPIPR